MQKCIHYIFLKVFQYTHTQITLLGAPIQLYNTNI